MTCDERGIVYLIILYTLCKYTFYLGRIAHKRNPNFLSFYVIDDYIRYAQ